MRLRNLNTFVKVARLGSFHAAAQQLHATQPAISARINALEEELGAQLFIRDKSGTRISSRGMQLLPYAEKLLAISQEMKQQITDQNPQKGTLRIGITDTLGHLYLSPLLQQWQQQHPLMSFELISDVTPTLTRQLQDNQLDLALMVAGDNNQRGLVTEPLCSFPQSWCTTPQRLLDNPVNSVESLCQSPILSFPRDTRPWDYLQTLFRSLEETPIFHTCSSVANLLTLTLEGAGMALLPEPVIRPYLEQGRLVQVNPGPKPPELPFCACWRLDDDRILPQLLVKSGREIIVNTA
ncbi:LysR family transcriptional regulator [Amphritea sp. 2_MG-2023]|jgi:DNA-binding transcriptional LysR family regulator|uniref:LysR family transcriptional regulator n=1 Tax=Amphritea TaxID=515417 RepID=UPI001C069E31|nr:MULTISPECIES: LysR family transcriptional regulator [Amphritea]MBU2964228.1 LysR family transcriptional regulator [Amphritea atlantica]MDO6419515.1 LysR family transcriptional regulator [Amphritea sp. 2_MG-2023]MDX2422703.1 LysR family transcriptional regulator [Amphritea sp.]